VFTLKILAADNMKSNKLKKHPERACVEFVGKTPEFFHRKLHECNKQKQAFSKI
jgi:hypothetical protein